MAASSNSEADVETPAQSAVSREAHEERSASAPPPRKKIEHLGGHRQYWRDIILGVNDGLVSTFLLVMGVWGGGLSSKDILLTSVSGALAGAISMCAGEYVATKSQNQVLSGEIQLETTHVQSWRYLVWSICSWIVAIGSSLCIYRFPVICHHRSWCIDRDGANVGRSDQNMGNERKLH